jgi:hydrogenase nickel incorporation protein HypA/HybF
MHEYSIVQSLVDSVVAAVETRKDTVVRSVRVSIGEVAGVDCGLLTTAYEVFRAGTLCENAAMTIDRIPARWECPLCSAVIARGAVLQCPQCHEPAFMAAGDEIILQRVELEVA